MAKIFNKKAVKFSIGLVIVFTILDYILHLIGIEGLFPQLGMLPGFYFIGKILVILVAVPILINFLKVDLSRFSGKSVIFCVLLSTILQVRYFYTAGYDFQINLAMMLIHYFLILISVFVLIF